MNISKKRNLIMAIAAHKSFDFPDENSYLPVHAGKALTSDDLGILGDDTGENISVKNPYFCELTVLFWIWKNIKANYISLSHYRRYFKPLTRDGCYCNGTKIVSSKEVQNAMISYDIILPKKRHYFIQDVYSHFCNAHYEEDLINLKRVIEEICPEYITAFDNVMKSRSLHLYNMFIMHWELFDQYMQWLFHILSEMENVIKIEKYPNSYQKRIFGFLSERLLNVWTHKNSNKYRIKSWPVVEIGGDSLIKKAIFLIGRKLGYTPLKNSQN